MTLSRVLARWSVLFALIFTAWLVGRFFCHSPRYPDNSTLTITPGVGIKGVLELDMSLRQIKWHTRDLRIVEYESSVGCSVPSLGIQWGQLKERGIFDFSVLVDPTVLNQSLSPLTLTPFRGMIGSKLSCHEPSGLTRDQVVSAFGEPTNRVDLIGTGWEGLHTDATNQYALWNLGITRSCMTAPHTEVLSYPTHGILFALRSNIVYSVTIRGRSGV